jgi:hypothetical protein
MNSGWLDDGMLRESHPLTLTSAMVVPSCTTSLMLSMSCTDPSPFSSLTSSTSLSYSNTSKNVLPLSSVAHEMMLTTIVPITIPSNNTVHNNHHCHVPSHSIPYGNDVLADTHQGSARPSSFSPVSVVSPVTPVSPVSVSSPLSPSMSSVSSTKSSNTTVLSSLSRNNGAVALTVQSPLFTISSTSTILSSTALARLRTNFINSNHYTNNNNANNTTMSNSNATISSSSTNGTRIWRGALPHYFDPSPPELEMMDPLFVPYVHHNNGTSSAASSTSITDMDVLPDVVSISSLSQVYMTSRAKETPSSPTSPTSSSSSFDDGIDVAPSSPHSVELPMVPSSTTTTTPMNSNEGQDRVERRGGKRPAHVLLFPTARRARGTGYRALRKLREQEAASSSSSKGKGTSRKTVNSVVGATKQRSSTNRMTTAPSPSSPSVRITRSSKNRGAAGKNTTVKDVIAIAHDIVHRISNGRIVA